MKQGKKWGFDTRDMDTNVRAQNDFFHYAGGTWLKKNPIPKAENRWGSFSKLRKETDYRLHALLKATKEPLIKNFYASGVDMTKRRALGAKPIQPWLEKIAKVKSIKELIALWAHLDRIGGGGVFGIGIDQDMKNSERSMIYLGQSGLGMPDRNYYLKDDAESKRVRAAYEKHLVKMFQLLGNTKEAVANAAVVMRLETAIAKVSMTKEDLREVDTIYHKLSLTGLEKLAPKIGWRNYFKISGHVPKDLIVMQPEFMKAIERILYAHPIEEWKVYARWHVASDFASYLSPQFERENFAFYATALTGVKQMKPLWRRSLGVVNACLGELLGELYVQKHFTAAAKKKMLEMVADLFTAYEARIKQLDWMSPATKKKAIIKLHMMVRKIGYPDKWKSYKGLVSKADDYVGNIMRACEFEHQRQMRKLSKKVDRAEWLMYPQTVNAYCNFGTNDIAFPAAILQPPFFSPSSDDAINYGAIGSVIGHEITHGFDDQGAKFDGKGNRKTWWTLRDQKLFKQKAKRVVEQFNNYKVADGVAVNGQLTLGENIADLGGISIAYDAYQLRLAKTGRKDISGFSPEQRFFFGASLFEREHSRPEFSKLQVTTDPHSPAIFRVNGPFSNLPEFYEAFAVTKSDKLYRAPADRAKIW